MRKWFGISAVALLIATVVLVTRYDKLHDTGRESYHAKCVQSNDPSATAADLVCTIEHSRGAQDAEYKPAWWHVFLAWPEGVTAWLLLLTLGAIVWQAWETRKAAETSEKQITLQSAALRQWVNVVPLGIVISRRLENPCEVELQFEILNKTDYLATIKKVEFELIPNIHDIGKFNVDCDFPLAPRTKDADSAFPFTGKCVIDVGELDGWGKIFIVAGDITFLDCMERQQFQHFQDLYRGFVDGRLERMKPSSIAGPEGKPEGQNPN